MVAASLSRHEHHAVSSRLFAKAKSSPGACAAHSLAEVYSKLTGMPKPFRVPSDVAAQIVQEIEQSLSVVPLTAAEYVATIGSLPALGLTGAIVFDALLLACARKIDATEIYTFNAKHFRLVAPNLADRIQLP